LTLDDFCSRLKGVQGSGKQRKALCPAHDDEKPSLSVSVDEKEGKILLYCHASCEYQDILHAMNLTKRDLYTTPLRKNDTSTYIKPIHYEYLDDNGMPILRKVRYYKNGEKGFYWQHKDKKGKWQKGNGGIPAPLFNQIFLSTSTDTVYIVEGEKDALTLVENGILAVYSPHGAGGKEKWNARYTEALTGRDVVILPDNDVSGKRFAEDIAAALHGKAKSVKLADLTNIWKDLPEKSDITDVFERERNKALTLEKLEKLVSETPEYDGTIKRKFPMEEDFKAAVNIATIQSPEQLKKYPLDDIGTAKLFADVFRSVIMYVPEYKRFYTYHNGCWELDMEDLRTKQYIKSFSDMTKNIIPPAAPPQADGEKIDDPWLIYRKHHLKYRALKFRDSLCRDVKSELHGSISKFDTQSYLFNCKNGTLNLNTGQLQPHKAQDNLSKMGRVIYDPAATCDRFIKFIDEITEGKKDRAKMLQKALGYCLKGEANEECYFTVIGQKTRNGKGTLFDTVMNIFGDYGAQIDFNSLARGGAKDGSRATPDIARLIGVRLALSNEPDKGVYVNEALLKQLTGNDDITARPLYGDVVQFKPVFRLFVTANSKPSVADDSLFASDRIKLLPFTKHFGDEERDTNLKALFRTEEVKSAILNWLVEGYRMYQAEGLKNTAEMEVLTAEYRKENDLIGMYLNDRVNLDSTEKTTIKALRLDYEIWCKVIGSKPLGLRMFKEELEKKDIEIFTYNKQFRIHGKIHGGHDYANEQF
jgi:phage/plasmid primase, P4 family, C-terminal domain